MRHHHLPLHFSIPNEDALNILEAVLAIARRGGLELGALRLHSGAHAAKVCLQVRASERELIDLFLARLHNVIGIEELSHADTMCIAKEPVMTDTCGFHD